MNPLARLILWRTLLTPLALFFLVFEAWMALGWSMMGDPGFARMLGGDTLENAVAWFSGNTREL